MPLEEKRRIAVVLARFEDIVARGLRALLEEDGSVEIVATDVEQSRLPVQLLAHNPDVALLNFGSLRSPAEVRHLRTQHPDTQLVLLANHPSAAECAQMLAFGASACLGKATQARDVVSAVHLAARGMKLFPSAERRGAAPESELLTRRETEVLELLREGRQSTEIAAALGISTGTVRAHARNLYRKLGVSSRRDLLAPSAQAAPSSLAATVRAPAQPRPRKRADARSRMHLVPVDPR